MMLLTLIGVLTLLACAATMYLRQHLLAAAVLTGLAIGLGAPHLAVWGV